MSLPPRFNTIGVIVGRDLVGDALIKLPFLRALRNGFPQAQIHWITSQGPTAYAAQLRDPTHGLIDMFHEQPPWLESLSGHNAPFTLPEIVAAVRQKNASSGGGAAATPPFFDLLIDTRNRWRESLYARRLPHGLYLSPAMHFLFSEKRPPFLGSRPDHLSDRLVDMVELAAGFRPPSTGALPVPDDIMEKARKILPPGNTYVGLAPGAGYRAKAWPRFKFEKVAAMQAEHGRIPVFILGPQELSWYDELRATVPVAKFPLQEYELWGRTSLAIEHTLAIGRLLDAAVANDSGVGHMLAAADCPLISLFGPTSPDKLAPRVSRGVVIRAQKFGSSLMRAISWEAVNEAIDKMLAERKSGG